MIDRTDLQLMLLEHFFEMDTDELIELFQQLTGHELEIYNEETEEMIRSWRACRNASSRRITPYHKEKTLVPPQ